MAIICPMQPDRWLRSRDLTSVFTPSLVDKKRVTSFMHSLNPARYLLRTVESAVSAANKKKRSLFLEDVLDEILCALCSLFFSK